MLLSITIMENYDISKDNFTYSIYDSTNDRKIHILLNEFNSLLLSKDIANKIIFIVDGYIKEYGYDNDKEIVVKLDYDYER